LRSLPSALLVCTLLAGCSREHPQRNAITHLELENAAVEATYLAPPQVTAAQTSRDGSIQVSGRASPMALVSFSTPEGDSFHATANAQGLWTARLPKAGLPRLFAISSSVDKQRPVHAEGALVTIPHASVPAVVVRAGYPAMPVGPSHAAALVSVDYDPGGFAGVSGLAAPGSTVRLGVDGLPAGVTQADAQGRFSMLAANRRPGFGQHELELGTSDGVIRHTVVLTAPGPLTRPYTASGEPGNWTVEWALNGGGEQTTLLVAAPRS
jgi:hypothetical protein